MKTKKGMCVCVSQTNVWFQLHLHAIAWKTAHWYDDDYFLFNMNQVIAMMFLEYGLIRNAAKCWDIYIIQRTVYTYACSTCIYTCIRKQATHKF